MAKIDFKRYQLALIITAVVVIIYLCILAIQYFGSKKTQVRYPPWLSPCPDYWTHDGSGNCTQIHDVNGEHNGAKKSEADKSANLGNMTLQQKCRWAKESANSVYWQGISDVPCESDSFTQYT